MGQRHSARLHLGLVGDRPGNLDGSGNSSRRFIANKTGKSTVTVTITMTDTGYTFTLPPRK